MYFNRPAHLSRALPHDLKAESMASGRLHHRLESNAVVLNGRFGAAVV